MIGIPCGAAREVIPSAEVRTLEQRAFVTRIVQGEDFDFALNNPFNAEVGNYTGPFGFLYRTLDGVLHAVRIGKRGNVLAGRQASRRVVEVELPDGRSVICGGSEGFTEDQIRAGMRAWAIWLDAGSVDEAIAKAENMILARKDTALSA